MLKERVTVTTAAVAVLAVATLYALARFSGSSRVHNHCQVLQRSGWWVDNSSLVWQPQGCTQRQYAYDDVVRCMKSPRTTSVGQYALFIGDSTVRDKFFAWARLVDVDVDGDAKVHSDITVRWPGEAGIAALFVWDPYLKGEVAQQVLHGAYNETLEQPRLVLLGAGAWHLRYANESGGIVNWRRTMDGVVQRLAESRRDGAAPIADHVYLSPVAPVVPDKLSPERLATLDPAAITWMNAYMQAAELPVFSSWTDMARARPLETTDGLHYSAGLERAAVNLLLNRVCNRDTIDPHPPMRTTCCFEYPAPGSFVRWYAAATLTALALLVAHSRWATIPRIVPSAATLRQLLVFGGILLIMFVCDRTPLFEKLHKHYIAWVFTAMLALATVGGAATWSADKSEAFLGRAQTDEWKGWMQIVILAYHAMNASGVSGIYNPVRVLVAMYLFMTGYGHCCFFYAKRDYGLQRLTAVLLRTNVLAIALAYVMGTSYMDYYFAPLSSAWVLIVWATMRVAPAANYTHLAWAKLAASAVIMCLINGLHLWPFTLLERLGVMWSAREWEFRFGTDIYIVYVGMAVALVRLQYGSQLLVHPRWPQLVRWSVPASILGLVLYFYFELTRASKFEYNKWHPYVSPLPVLCFIVLRNANAYLRSHSSAMFRAAGLISLELFIAQFHLFLAADTKAILVLVDSRLWFVNFGVTAFVFVGLCQALGSASGTITAWLMAKVSVDAPAVDIPMSELPVAADRPRALDRLASDPPLLARMASLPIFDSLALRWAIGLFALVLLNNYYD
ncbi:hypothetical protein GGH19_005372 [Coemansia sp. RSA 1807]|nr:hypothetical protein GGH19_005372 [Coemansia sp. RSA 1807]